MFKSKIGRIFGAHKVTINAFIKNNHLEDNDNGDTKI